MKALLLILALLTSAAASASGKIHSRYFNGVFSGDLSWMADFEASTAAESELKQKFVARFVDAAQPTAMAELDDDFVRAAAGLHLHYWRTALQQPARLDQAEASLIDDISALLTQHQIALTDDPMEAMGSAIEARGYSFRGGRTAPLLDFMLWRKTESRTFEVKLSDGPQQVLVHFMSDFVFRGWSSFATFGMTGTGGWADPDALYCMADHYDRQSEDFLNSYLRHEGRHFADYALYPKLQGADLEYRGKLTELIYASEPRTLIDKFARAANFQTTAPHPLANAHVVDRLARKLDGNGAGTASAVLADASGEQISAAAAALLDAHSAELNGLGADGTSGVIAPIID